MVLHLRMQFIPTQSCAFEYAGSQLKIFASVGIFDRACRTYGTLVGI